MSSLLTARIALAIMRQAGDLAWQQAAAPPSSSSSEDPDEANLKWAAPAVSNLEEEAGFPRSADAAAPPVDPPTGFPFDLDPPAEAEADLEEDQKMLKGYNEKPAAAHVKKELAPNAIK